MNEEYKQIGSKHINSFGNASQFWGYYYYKMYRVGTKMFYRLKARLTYVNTTGAEGYYQDQAVAQFRINTGGEPNYNSTKVIKPTTYGYFYNGQYWEVESDWFSFDKVEGKTKCEINLNNSVTYGFDSPNYSFELDIVTALSTLTVNNGTSFAVDTNENKSNTIPVLLTKYDDSYTHKLKITMENSQNTQTVIRDYTTFTGNTLTFSSTELTKIYSNTNSQNISLIFDLDTYSGSNKIGTSTLKMSAYLSTTDLYPTFTTTFLETNDKVVKLLGSGASTLVQNASKLKTTVVPKGHKSATIKNVQFLHNQLMTSKTTSPYEYTFNVANSIFNVAVTDSRNLVTSTEYKKNIIEYIPVKINNLRFKRQNMTGSNVLLSAQISYKQATFGSTKNTPTIKWKKGASGTLKTLTTSDYTVDSANNLIKIENLLLSNVIDYQSTDDFYLTVSDLLSEDEDMDTVLKGVPTYEAGEHDFQVNGTLYVADTNRQNKKKVATTSDVPSVVNNLTSSSTTSALSAYQGKVLNDKITELTVKSAISIGYNASSHLALTTSNKKINCNEVLCMSGTKLTFDSTNYGVKIGSNVKKVLISALGTFSFAGNDAMNNNIICKYYYAIAKNDTVLARTYVGKMPGYGGSYLGVSISPLLIDVKQGDIITLLTSCDIANTFFIENNSSVHNNHLTVEVIE